MSDYDTDDDLSSSPSDDPVFKPGIKDIERVGLQGAIYLGNIPSNRIERAMMDPLDRFRMYVNAISRRLNNWEDVDISDKSIEKMLEKSALLEAVGYKNPNAYIMGFIATGGGLKLSKEKFDYTIKKVLPHVEDSTVFPQDVIRYARLWETLR